MRRKLRRAEGTADVFILYRLEQQLQQRQTCLFSPLVADPVDAAIMQPQELFRWCSYMGTAQRSLSEDLVTHIRSVISDLSCYIIMYTKQNVSQEAVGQASLTVPLWLICSFPTTGQGGYWTAVADCLQR